MTHKQYNAARLALWILDELTNFPVLPSKRPPRPETYQPPLGLEEMGEETYLFAGTIDFPPFKGIDPETARAPREEIDRQWNEAREALEEIVKAGEAYEKLGEHFREAGEFAKYRQMAHNQPWHIHVPKGKSKEALEAFENFARTKNWKDVPFIFITEDSLTDEDRYNVESCRRSHTTSLATDLMVDIIDKLAPPPPDYWRDNIERKKNEK